MNNTVGVCVLNGLGELADQVDLATEVEFRAVVGQPEVEALIVGVVRKDEPASELVLDDVLRSEDARMVEPRRQRILAFGELARTGDLSLGSAPWRSEEPDPGQLADHSMLGRPVLPVVGLVESLAR